MTSDATATNVIRKEPLTTDEWTHSPRHSKKNKNTVKWCKGKVGREHIMGSVRLSTYECGTGAYCVHVAACTVCGKHFDFIPCPDNT